jgi:hypothetical protein
MGERVAMSSQCDAWHQEHGSSSQACLPALPLGSMLAASSSSIASEQPSNISKDSNVSDELQGFRPCEPNNESSHHNQPSNEFETSGVSYSNPLHVDYWAGDGNARDELKASLRNEQHPAHTQDPTAVFSERMPVLNDPSRTRLSPSSEPMPWLVTVLGNILQQVTELSHCSWNLEMMHMSWFDGYDPVSTSRLDLLNPLEHLVVLMLKFVLMLQVAKPNNRSFNVSSLNLSTTLMVLSAYLKFIHLLDTMLTQISRCLYLEANQQPHMLTSDGMTKEDFRSLSRNKMDLSPLLQDGKAFHLTIIIQIFENQLQTMERLMDLPTEYRRWSHASPGTDTPGIFSHLDAYLLQSIMDQDQAFGGGQAKTQLSSVQNTMENLKYSSVFQ